MRSVVTNSLAIFFSIFEHWKSVGLCQTWWPIELKFEKEFRQAGRQAGSTLLTPASHLPQIWQKSTKKQQKEKARKISNTGIVSRLVYLDIYIYMYFSECWEAWLLVWSLYQYFIQRTHLVLWVLKELWQFSNSFQFWMKPSLVQLSDEPFFGSLKPLRFWFCLTKLKCCLV